MPLFTFLFIFVAMFAPTPTAFSILEEATLNATQESHVKEQKGGTITDFCILDEVQLIRSFLIGGAGSSSPNRQLLILQRAAHSYGF